MRRTTLFLGSLLVAMSVFAAGEASAKACRDASGKFVKCAVATPASGGAKHCKDASGKFAKCSAPGAVPVASPASAVKPGAPAKPK